MSKFVRLSLFASIIFFVGQRGVNADSLDDIKKRGTIYIGVKADLKPWGFRQGDGGFEGMEIELAQDIAKRLKVKLEPVPAISSERVQLITEGKVDLILATFSVTEERKKQVLFIEPNYYAAMTGVLSKTGSGIGGEATLQGRKICAVTGAFYNPAIARLTGRELVESKTLVEADEKLRADACEALAFDDVALLYRVKSDQEKWKNYDLSLLLTVTPAPWGIAIHNDEKDGKFARFLTNTIIDWHKDGTLLALEKKWVGDNSMALQWLTNKVKESGALTKVAEPRRPSREREARPRPSERRQPENFNPFLN